MGGGGGAYRIYHVERKNVNVERNVEFMWKIKCIKRIQVIESEVKVNGLVL